MFYQLWKFKPACVVSTLKYGGGSVMIWGCMSASGVGQMFVCEGRVDSVKYVNFLESVLLPCNTNMDGVKFQQDHATCYKAVRTMAWLREDDMMYFD
ncbi:hypothetical protein Trydic_g13578 [Trypoxylus dichotomus]